MPKSPKRFRQGRRSLLRSTWKVPRLLPWLRVSDEHEWCIETTGQVLSEHWRSINRYLLVDEDCDQSSNTQHGTD